MFRIALTALALTLTTPALACGGYGSFETITLSDADGVERVRFEPMSGQVEVHGSGGWAALDSTSRYWSARIEGGQLVLVGWNTKHQVTERWTLDGKRVSSERLAS